MSKPQLSPSSANTGFFQSPPRLENQYTSDPVLPRLLSLYLPLATLTTATPSLNHLGALSVSPPVLSHLANAERHLPTIEDRTTFGVRKSALHTSEGWRALGKICAEEGIIQTAYESEYGPYARIIMFAKYYIFSPSSALYTCPLAMTDAAATVLTAQLRSKSLSPELRTIFQDAFDRLTTRDLQRVWTSGQWMTERPGGSDVKNSETTAVYDEKEGWKVSGHKWFSSATDSSMTIMLARTNTSPGLSCFYAPQRLADGMSNGIRIVRLKNKLGTKPLPTAELELVDTKAWLVGEEGRGISYIATMLTITRVHTAVSAISYHRRGLAIAKAFAKVRSVQGSLLSANALHLHTLAGVELSLRAGTHLTFFSVALLGMDERPFDPSTSPAAGILPKTAEGTKDLLRVLTPIVKVWTAKEGIKGLAECMEALGGVGYLENEQELNIARLFRDVNVLSIWEGTTNVLAIDTIRALTKGNSLKAVNTWVELVLGEMKGVEAISIRETWLGVSSRIQKTTAEEMIPEGRRVVWSLVYVVVGCLMVWDAKDGDVVALECLRRWVIDGKGRDGFELYSFREDTTSKETQVALEKRRQLDSLIVFGHGIAAQSKI